MKVAIISGSEKSGKSFVATNLASVSNWAYFDCDFFNSKANLYFPCEKANYVKVTKNLPLIAEERLANSQSLIEECKNNAFFESASGVEYSFLPCLECDECSINNVNLSEEKQVELGEYCNYQNEKLQIYSANCKDKNFKSALLNEILNKTQVSNVYLDLPGELNAFTISAIKQADFCLIVEEPSSFTFDKFKGCLRAVKLLSKPYAVVFNKTTSVSSQFSDYCYQQNARIFTTFPNFIKEEKLISDCKVLSKMKLTHKQSFLSLHNLIKKK